MAQLGIPPTQYYVLFAMTSCNLLYSICYFIIINYIIVFIEFISLAL